MAQNRISLRHAQTRRGLRSLRGFAKTGEKLSMRMPGRGSGCRFSVQCHGIGGFTICDFRVDAVAGMSIDGPRDTLKFGWGGMQEHTESTHEDEEIPTQKDTCRAAFEEDCSPAGSPQPLLSKLLKKQPFMIEHLFLRSLCCSAFILFENSIKC